MDEGDLAAVAADSLEAGLAIVDPVGKITWSNASWREPGQHAASSNGAATPDTLADLAAGARGSAAEAIERGIRSVIDGDSAKFQLEYHGDSDRPRHFILSATPLRGDSRGAVVMRRQIRTQHDTRDVGIGAGRHQVAGPPVDRLTPRELQILALLARGLPNRAIARELDIEYTTVRGYVQSLIEKFGASSRIEAVAMAYRWGMVE